MPTTTTTQPYVMTRARFGRAPRIVLPSQLKKTERPARTSTDSAFDARFTRMAHRNRFREIAKAMGHFGEVSERICKTYATYSIGGTQFAVVKPLSDGDIRVGVALPETDEALAAPSGLGNSDRINGQFELASHEALNGAQLGWLRKAYNSAVAED